MKKKLQLTRQTRYWGCTYPHVIDAPLLHFVWEEIAFGALICTRIFCRRGCYQACYKNRRAIYSSPSPWQNANSTGIKRGSLSSNLLIDNLAVFLEPWIIMPNIPFMRFDLFGPWMLCIFQYITLQLVDLNRSSQPWLPSPPSGPPRAPDGG